MISTYYRKKVQSIKDFDYTINYKELDLRKHPELYRIGRWEQWVLLVEPYKSEILPFRKFKTPEIAEKSAKKIYKLFLAYLKAKDFVGADMARKFLQMGYTRSRRYANHATGKKYVSNPQEAHNASEEKRLRSATRPQEDDRWTNEKAQSARVFYGYYEKAKNHKLYLSSKKAFEKKYLQS